MNETITKAKDILEREAIDVSDFVTINDDSDIVEVYVVKSINGTTATIYALELTSERDDILITEKTTALNELIHIDDSFVTVNSIMWKIREMVTSGRHIDIDPLYKIAI